MNALDDLCGLIEELGKATAFEVAAFYCLVVLFVAAFPMLALAGLVYLLSLIAEAW